MFEIGTTLGVSALLSAAGVEPDGLSDAVLWSVSLVSTDRSRFSRTMIVSSLLNVSPILSHFNNVNRESYKEDFWSCFDRFSGPGSAF